MNSFSLRPMGKQQQTIFKFVKSMDEPEECAAKMAAENKRKKDAVIAAEAEKLKLANKRGPGRPSLAHSTPSSPPPKSSTGLQSARQDLPTAMRFGGKPGRMITLKSKILQEDSAGPILARPLQACIT